MSFKRRPSIRLTLGLLRVQEVVLAAEQEAVEAVEAAVVREVVLVAVANVPPRREKG